MATTGLAAAAGEKTRSLPRFDKVEENVRRYFANVGREPEQVICKSDVKRLFRMLALMGFEVPDRLGIVNQIPKDNSFMVRTLRTKKGEKFVAQISKYPGSLDRLDRLSRLPQGRQMVRDLIKGPDGYKMFKYMVESPGGKELGNMLGNASKGANFNEPTGRLYTAGLLIARLKKSYQRVEKSREKPAK